MKKPNIRGLVCLSCGAIGQARKIVYGMPSDDFDFEKYAVGGCIIEEDAPDVECKGCGYRWKR